VLAAGLLQVIDKIEREKPEALAVKLEKFGLTEVEVREFINNPDNASDAFKQIEADLTARGLGGGQCLKFLIKAGRCERLQGADAMMTY